MMEPWKSQNGDRLPLKEVLLHLEAAANCLIGCKGGR